METSEVCHPFWTLKFLDLGGKNWLSHLQRKSIKQKLFSILVEGSLWSLNQCQQQGFWEYEEIQELQWFAGLLGSEKDNREFLLLDLVNVKS